MRWLTRENAIAETESIRDSLGPPQVLSFAINSEELYRLIPIPPADTPEDEDFAGPVDRWYGYINERYFTLDIHRSNDHSLLVGCNITAPYPTNATFDWMTIHELNGLPTAVQLQHVAFIESRGEDPSYVVYLDAPQGFDCPIYSATSLSDAECLIDFLHKSDDAWSYWIGNPEQQGSWQLWHDFDSNRKLVGNYPDRASSVALACRLTQKQYDGIRVVSGSGPDNREYFVRKGVVVKVEKT